ncbi:aryl-alcohol dehydrogenase-like predicted oxidoreductase [Paenibacillus rhizosphaerae]|uniref:Aryl-alcohol dehydrogenase-like predicted oxidoreductase n=1 Tax=Paenibacillus rhizosphaerae TaxID=297318 RepID=A0A839U0V2_9BACL|nr:aldo/keto reductase [Paenibacillus rhizosphaerae]MBB3131268.1 aryl-alcohol dehydrogenase-like predicted oxidoreductase [Paenibacillus rhizosphaerae]
MNKRKLGNSNVELPVIGLGCMGMSGGVYGNADRKESIATIHAAMEAGISLLDTGDFYLSGHNEMLVAEALQGKKREDAFIAVKFGVMRDPQGGFTGIDGRPEAVKNFLAMTLQRLNTDYIDLYQPARLDPNVPIEETIGAISDMVQAGYVRNIGLSEVGVDTIRRAHAVHPISWLQIEYSLFSRGIEQKILPVLRELGISLNPYGVLDRGLLSGKWTKERAVKPGDFRESSPRLRKGNLERNLELVEKLRKVAEERGVNVAQLAIAWVIGQGQDILPLIGARKQTQLEDALYAAEIDLSGAEVEVISTLFHPDEVAGDRYDEHQMALLDSEK